MLARSTELKPSAPRLQTRRRVVAFVCAGAILTALLFLHVTQIPQAWLLAPESLRHRLGSLVSATSAARVEALFAEPGWTWADIESAASDDAQCRFVSTLEGLAETDRHLAAAMELEEVTPGIVKARTGGDAHPVLGLLHQGEQRWIEKLGSQSETLKDAVNTYRHRWHRPPPKGFDQWYEFARSKGVMLIDEYDEVMQSLLPFYGLSVESLQTRLQEAEQVPGTIVFQIEDGQIRALEETAFDSWPAVQARSTVGLLQPIAHLLPQARFVLNPWDEPRVVMNNSVRTRLREAALTHAPIDIADRDTSLPLSYRDVCDPPQASSKPSDLPDADTFILDHKASMDPCTDPAQFDLHGAYVALITPNRRPVSRLLPLFSPSTTAVNADIAFTPWGWGWDTQERAPQEKPWDEKSAKLFWQGSSTGLHRDKARSPLWRQSHRERLVALAKEENHKSGGRGMLNITYGGEPIQCATYDGTCAELAAEYTFAPSAGMFRSDDFKYLIDVDGNGWSSRMRRITSTNNVLFKSTIFPEFYVDTLPEWFAYVPTKLDYSDVLPTLQFFAGHGNEQQAEDHHDEVARRIAHNGKCWVERAWREADVQVYMYRLLLEYARLSSPHRDDGTMDFVMD